MRHANTFNLWRWALLGSCWLAGQTAAAQIRNLDFDLVTCSPGVSPFYDGCVPGWAPSHGSPQLHQFATNPGTFAPHNRAYMWSTSSLRSGGGGGEGMFFQLNNVVSGEGYTIKFFARNSPNSGPGQGTSSTYTRLAVKIATNLTAGGSNAPGQDIRSGISVIDEGWYNLTDDWQHYTYTFTANSAGPFQVWFYPEYRGQFSHMEMDRVEITGCHTMDVYYQHNDYNLPPLTKTQGRIKAGSDVTAGSQDAVRMEPGNVVEFRSLTEIELRGNVEVQAGAEFTATVPACWGFTPQAVAAVPTTPATVAAAAAARSTSPTSSAQPAGTESAAMPMPPCACLAGGIARPANEEAAIGPDRNPEPVDKAQVLAYPNPANDQLTLPARAERIELYNPSGKSVPLPPRRDNMLDVRGLPEGLYQLRLYVDDKPVTQRIQIKH